MTRDDSPAFDSETPLPGWQHTYSGKVRDLYTPDDADPVLGADRMLVVASDRVSAYDSVLEPGIPGKGELLTELSLWWFAQLADVPNHLLPGDVPEAVRGRAMLVKTLDMFPIECVVRGYLSGSGWKEYRSTGSVCGVALPEGLQDGDRLPEPIYTPAWKAPQGEHDENITFERTVEIVGDAAAEALRTLSLRVYAEAAAIALARGVILADTKFEFGVEPASGVVTLADEVLTSDSSRYWDAEAYDAGRRGESFDKQIVRDWLSSEWDGQGTPPALPHEIVERTAARYRELIDRLTR
ncbi:phosphoribosylaminoimidazolesuccinocarboxamide synthase [Rathayibacter sp. VKM Ac-2754]|uniref:phosphoribosylaminoimidazolesuccinocarboxamide synthase n=1 Tax=Rathayibacter sp. VKM Ac-2754 TaxID=2609251 RepID=UPI00135A3BBF|nr:phosphoribosylaminoimidazolesuccinocarboxamide synthase [Rathayibacter sp. VKM Ac-2754]MWV60804.1 phosphoribosylaminoimidazolesuccinocarboxamide synthase [Rathayibacter sp. VKM Ac-2754]